MDFLTPKGAGLDYYNYPTLFLGEDGYVKTALQEKIFAARLAAAQRYTLATAHAHCQTKNTKHANNNTNKHKKNNNNKLETTRTRY